VVLGSNLLEYISTDRRDSFQDLIHRANVDNQVKSVAPFEVNGEEYWFDVSVMPVRNQIGKITGYCITSHDITAVRKAQVEVARLNKSLIDFQNAVHRSSIVSITDRQGIITFVNDNFITISGYSPDELVGKNHRIINSEYHPSSFWKEMWSTISSGNVWHNRIKNRGKNGSHYWVDTFIMPFLDSQGNIESYLSITYDITERTQAEEDLVQKSLLLQEATRMAKIGYWLHDRRKGSSVVSPEMLTLLGVSASEYNRNAAVLFSRVHPEDAGTLPSIPQLSQMNSEKVEIEYRVKTSDGSIRWIHQRSEANPIDANQDVIIGTVQDITERKIIEQILRDYNERFEILSKATNDAIWDLDIRLEVVVWNYALTELFGYVEGQIEYNFTWWQQRIHPDDRANVLQDLEHVMMNKKNTWRISYRFRCADNSYKHVYNRAYILYEKNIPIRIIGSIQDISERVRSSREIEKLSLVASATNNGVMITDKDGHIEWINKSIEKLTGYTLNEVIGKKPSFLQGKESDKSTIERISKNLKEQQFVSEEIINYTKTGNKFWLKLDIAPVFNSQGLLTNFIAIQTDITEIKEFQRSITNIARELASLIENANVPIFGIDINGYINEWNGIAEKLTGFSKNEVIARQWQEIFRIPTQENNLKKLIKNVLSNTPESNFELPLLTKDENKLMILISGSPRRNVENEITGALFVGQDITELSDYRSNLEQMVDKRTTELHVSLNKEKELVKLKSQFVSIASHEFRTPLTSIGLAAGFIRKYKSKLSPEGIDEKIINIEKQVTHMTYLLDDILMIGKAEAGKIPVNLAPIKISEFTRNLCFEVAKTTGNTHHINLTEELRYLEIVSDEKLLRNVMINLLTNAIKFSPSAEVVEVKIITSGDTLLLTVRDYGIGIPKQELAHLFQPFFRARNAGTIQGTGLGLSIIKKAVDLLQGTIRIDSGQGEGTVMTIELPI
jgi:PAS domain S-box-containing protein